MKRILVQIGENLGLVLTPEMLDHLGIADAVEVTLEDGRIVLTAPIEVAEAKPDASVHPVPGRRMSFEEAMEYTMTAHEGVLHRLAQ